MDQEIILEISMEQEPHSSTITKHQQGRPTAAKLNEKIMTSLLQISQFQLNFNQRTQTKPSNNK